jgi:hypothetical protein
MGAIYGVIILHLPVFLPKLPLRVFFPLVGLPVQATPSWAIVPPKGITGAGQICRTIAL